MNKKKKISGICSAVVLLFCMCLIFFGCTGTDEPDKSNQTEVTDMIELNNWQFTYGVPNNAITVYSKKENKRRDSKRMYLGSG